MEKEIKETYYFDPSDFDINGKRLSDGMTFRDVVKGFERDFHGKHTTEFAQIFYANLATMNLLAKSNGAAPFLSYGMDLTQGNAFDAESDPYVNHEMEKHSQSVYVYGIDSAFMDSFDENGYPVIDDKHDVYPLTLLIDKDMRDNEVRLAVPTSDEEAEEEEATIDVSKYAYI